MKSMPSNKSPNGYAIEFFKAAWDTVGPLVTAALHEFFTLGKLLKEMITTIETLVPKCEVPSKVSNFRPLLLQCGLQMHSKNTRRQVER